MMITYSIEINLIIMCWIFRLSFYFLQADAEGFDSSGFLVVELVEGVVVLAGCWTFAPLVNPPVVEVLGVELCVLCVVVFGCSTLAPLENPPVEVLGVELCVVVFGCSTGAFLIIGVVSIFSDFSVFIASPLLGKEVVSSLGSSFLIALPRENSILGVGSVFSALLNPMSFFSGSLVIGISTVFVLLVNSILVMGTSVGMTNFSPFLNSSGFSSIGLGSSLVGAKLAPS